MLAISIAFELLKIVPNYIFARIIDQLVVLIEGAPGEALRTVAMLGGTFLAASALAHLVEFLKNTRTHRLMPRLYEYFAVLANRKILGLSLRYHESHNPSASVVKIHKGIWGTIELVFAFNDEVISTWLLILMTFAIILVLDWRSGLVFGTVVPLYLAHSLRIARQVQPYRDAFHEKDAQISGSLGQSFSLIRTVQDFAQEEQQEQELLRLTAESRRAWDIRSWFEDARAFWRDGLLLFARVGTLLFYTYMTIQGSLSPGLLVFFVTLTERSYVALQRTGRVIRRITDKIDHLRSLIELLDEKEDVTDAPDARELKDIEGRIEFRKATFAYPTSGSDVLDQVSFTVQPRQMVAIIGRSGSGKSTIVKVLYRHYDLISGAILVDGKDIREVTRESLRSQMGIVTQDVEIFDASIRENIRYGSPEATVQEVEEAAKVAYAHDFIMRFPRGYETVVGERGVRLSGGQKQRIGIARAILKKPAILVFDEATSSLDSESERLIQKAMEEMAKDYTMIVIAHRLSTIRNADLIVVMDEGRVVETGTHEELMRKGGLFHRMQGLQAVGEIRE